MGRHRLARNPPAKTLDFLLQVGHNHLMSYQDLTEFLKHSGRSFGPVPQPAKAVAFQHRLAVKRGSLALAVWTVRGPHFDPYKHM